MYDIDSPTWYIFANYTVFMHMEFANVFINVSGICQCFMLYCMQLINYVYRVAKYVFIQLEAQRLLNICIQRNMNYINIHNSTNKCTQSQIII